MKFDRSVRPAAPTLSKRQPRGRGGGCPVHDGRALARLCPPYELVNLSIFAIPHLNQIKDLAGAKIAKTGNIHILYAPLFLTHRKNKMAGTCPAISHSEDFRHLSGARPPSEKGSLLQDPAASDYLRYIGLEEPASGSPSGTTMRPHTRVS
jgi:hypothetical protein